VLDVGCGRGGPAAYVAGRLGAREVTGLDACADAIAFCQDRHRHPGLRFVHGHADRLPFEDASLDVVLNVESSHCYVDRPAFFAEVARVLRPGGAFCYADIFQGDELEQTRRWLAQRPQLRVGEPEDITAAVTRAIERHRAELAALLGSAVDPALENAAIIEHLIRAINGQIHENYASGRWRYYAWGIEKAET
jgi:ubiquinone/menaquinone biosynthesis C-methylase UbiE